MSAVASRACESSGRDDNGRTGVTRPRSVCCRRNGVVRTEEHMRDTPAAADPPVKKKTTASAVRTGRVAHAPQTPTPTPFASGQQVSGGISPPPGDAYYAPPSLGAPGETIFPYRRQPHRRLGASRYGSPHTHPRSGPCARHECREKYTQHLRFNPSPTVRRSKERYTLESRLYCGYAEICTHAHGGTYVCTRRCASVSEKKCFFFLEKCTSWFAQEE